MRLRRLSLRRPKFLSSGYAHSYVRYGHRFRSCYHCFLMLLYMLFNSHGLFRGTIFFLGMKSRKPMQTD